MANIDVNLRSELASRIQWHFDAHRLWGGRTLHYWFIRFRRRYDPSVRVDQLLSLLDEVGCQAYALYEVIGDSDIVARTWMPPLEVARFQEALDERFEPRKCRNYSVREVIRQWVWQDEAGQPTRASLNGIASSLDIRTIRDMVRLVNDASVHGRGVDVQLESDPLSLFARSALFREVPRTAGIRFIMRLTLNPDLDDEDQRRVHGQVGEELDRLADWNSQRPKTLEEASAYRCVDGSLILLGRLPFADFHNLRDGVITPISRLPGIEHTSTNVATSADFHEFREVLLLEGEGAPGGAVSRGVGAVTATPPSVHQLLERDEDEAFEIKGSAFAPLKPWLSRPAEAAGDEGLAESRGFFAKSVAKTVVAFLNTKGGILLIGALQEDVYRVSSDLEQLRLKEFPKEGRLRLAGLQDPIFHKSGWDGWSSRLNQQLRDYIDGEWAGRVSVYPEYIREQLLALILVEGPEPDDEFYLSKDGATGNSTFFIRRGASSEALYGRHVREFLRARDRRRH